MMGDDERVAVNGEHKNWRKPSSINVKKIHANRLFETVSLSLSFFLFLSSFCFLLHVCSLRLLCGFKNETKKNPLPNPLGNKNWIIIMSLTTEPI